MLSDEIDYNKRKKKKNYRVLRFSLFHINPLPKIIQDVLVNKRAPLNNRDVSNNSYNGVMQASSL